MHASEVAPAAVVGIDWGTTHRRVTALDARGRVLREFSDDDGMLRLGGRFGAALDAALQRMAPLAPRTRVLLSGMVGSAHGWHEVPYLDTALPLSELPAMLFTVPDAPEDVDCRIVPGYRWRGPGGRVDVMRGEETQLYGAVAMGRRDGLFVLPGTHSKWVQLRAGRIERFATHMTGELFSLLTQHGTLAPLMRESVEAPAAFEQGIAVAGDTALASALFGCRARVVAGQMAASSAREHLSGILIGAEWHDALRRFDTGTSPVGVIGAPQLAERYRHAAQRLGVQVELLSAKELQCAAWRGLGGAVD